MFHPRTTSDITTKTIKAFQHIENNKLLWGGILFALIASFGYGEYQVIKTGNADLIYAADNTSKPWTEACQKDHIPLNRDIIPVYLFCYSVKLGSPQIIPAIETLLILPISFILGRKLTGSNLGGVFAVSFIEWHQSLYHFATVSIYGQAWTDFVLFSIYIAIRKPVITPASYVLSLLSKSLSLAYLPVIALFLDLKQNRNIAYLMVLVFITGIGGTLVLSHGQFLGQEKLVMPSYEHVTSGLKDTWNSFTDSDGTYSLLKVMICGFDILSLYFLRNQKYGKQLFYSMIISVLSIPLVDIFVSGGFWFPYRMFVLISLSSISLSYILLNSILKHVIRNKI